MSRHRIPALSDKHYAIVGWDNPLQSFFAQIWDKAKDEADDDDAVVFRVGLEPGQPDILDVDKLQVMICDYAIIPDNVKAVLRHEFENRTQPYPMQKMVKELFREHFDEPPHREG